MALPRYCSSGFISRASSVERPLWRALRGAPANQQGPLWKAVAFPVEVGRYLPGPSYYVRGYPQQSHAHPRTRQSIKSTTPRGTCSLSIRRHSASLNFNPPSSTPIPTPSAIRQASPASAASTPPIHVPCDAADEARVGHLGCRVPRPSHIAPLDAETTHRALQQPCGPPNSPPWASSSSVRRRSVRCVQYPRDRADESRTERDSDESDPEGALMRLATTIRPSVAMVTPWHCAMLAMLTMSHRGRLRQEGTFRSMGSLHLHHAAHHRLLH